MAGFKWRRLFWGMNASPVEPGQIASGLILAVFFRMIFTTTVYYVLMVAFGAVGDPWGAAWMPLVGVLGGMAFGLPLMAYSASITQDKGQFALVNRFIFTPMFLFSGTFFPLTTLPVWLQWIGWVSPLWHASEIGRSLSYGLPPGSLAGRLALRRARRVRGRRLGARAPGVPTEAALMAVDVEVRRRPGSVGALYARNARSVVARGLQATRSTNWPVMLSGFFEPVFYLFAMGVGLGTYIGDVDAAVGCVGPLRRVHRAGAARGERDERRGLRLHVERVLQDALRQALRRDAHHVARPAGRRVRRDPHGPDPRRRVRGRVPDGHAGHGPEPGVVGRARRPRGAARGVRVREPRDGGDQLS